MNEISHLRSLCGPKPTRSTTPIKSPKTISGDWAYPVSSAFNAALDIKYEERKKNKKGYLVWTQGPYLSFKKGDVIHSTDGNSCLQVDDARAMEWDALKLEMNEGSVEYSGYEIRGGKYEKLYSISSSQIGFLQVLIEGSK